MHEPHTMIAQSESKIVYIREIALDELPDNIKEQAGDVASLYAIGNEKGEQLALVANRELAFDVARQNDMEPVSVH